MFAYNVKFNILFHTELNLQVRVGSGKNEGKIVSDSLSLQSYKKHKINDRDYST